MRLYLDNCCFNRPYDNQTQLKIYLETQAKLRIQSEILNQKYELVWSFILDYENAQNPFPMRKDNIIEWKRLAVLDIDSDDWIARYGESLSQMGIKNKDAWHIGCAVKAGCDVFLTTDKKLLNTPVKEIRIMNPIDFISEMEDSGWAQK